MRSLFDRRLSLPGTPLVALPGDEGDAAPRISVATTLPPDSPHSWGNGDEGQERRKDASVARTFHVEHGEGQKVLSANPHRLALMIQNHHTALSSMYVILASERVGHEAIKNDGSIAAIPLGAPGTVWVKPGELFTAPVLPPPWHVYKGPVFTVSVKFSPDEEFFFYDGVFTITEIVAGEWGD